MVEEAAARWVDVFLSAKLLMPSHSFIPIVTLLSLLRSNQPITGKVLYQFHPPLFLIFQGHLTATCLISLLVPV